MVEVPGEFANAHQWADSYRALGLAVIPARDREKIPLGGWKAFQSGIPQAVHDGWYGESGDNRANYRMGFLTGAASLGDGWKLLVIDLDEKGNVSGSATWDSWIADNEYGCEPETWRARTGGGGQHIYFRYRDHLSIRNTQETFTGIDVRAEGGFVIAPPSLHRNGKSYTWLFSPFEAELAEAPQWLLEKVGAAQAPPPAATLALSSALSSSSPSHTRTMVSHSSPPPRATDAWGHIVDGRDAYMRDMIWAAIVDWYRECPIAPPERETEQKLLEVFTVYERKVRSQAAGNTLDDEGRGLSAFRDKWVYAMRQWDTKVATAAKEKVADSIIAADTAPTAPPSHWDDPVDLWSKLSPPVLPTGVLPRQIETFAFEQAKQMGADPAGLAMAALAVCAAAIPDRVRIKVKRHGHWYENARLWVALIGSPSTRKSPIIGQAVRPIARLDGRLVRKYLADKARYDEMTKDERKEAERPRQRRLRIEDTTIEAAQEVLGDSPDGVLLIQDELSGWFGAMDKYNSGGRGAAKDRAFWLQSFNGGQYAVNRVGRGVSLIENLSVSMLGGIQPEAIAAVAKESVDDGLLQRLLPIVLQRASVGQDAPVYTRKSSEEGLEQEFNSLHAQREACEAYIASQRSEGWVLVRDQYDDGGISGGTLERPALKQLLADIENGLIDVVVVYKIDRLSRSLMDFSKLVEIFDRNGVTFVSVTQSFNTTTSMGRLTLNILLSFAQFEREVTAERIRDKIRASRQKGMWMGGIVPLGYRVENRKLVIEKTEAATVRMIFERFVTIGSATVLAKTLAAEGVRTRRSKLTDKGYLYKLLNNRVYIGEAVHKGKSYPGEHQPIIGRALWDKVHAILTESPRKRAARTRADTPALLKGLLFGPDGAAFSPTHTKKGGKLYRYYVSQSVLKHGAGSCPVGRLPAGEIEAAVIDQLRAIFRQPEIVAGTWKAARSQATDVTEADARAALQQLDPLWDELFPAEQARIVALLVQRVDVAANGLSIRLRTNGLTSLAAELGAIGSYQKKAA